MAIRSICVFCGSRPGVRSGHAAQADALGRLLASRDVTMVYGGGGAGVGSWLGEPAALLDWLGAGSQDLSKKRRELVDGKAPVGPESGVYLAYMSISGRPATQQAASAADFSTGLQKI